MICAVYARRSNDQSVPDEEKSVIRQIALAKTFAAEKGWQVTEQYVDDGISGRETAKLVNRARMLSDATAGKFAHVIVRDYDRLSRDDREGPSFVYMLQDAGVTVWEYSTRALIDTSSALKRTLISMKAGFAAHEAEAAASRTYEKKREQAARGALADGRTFGFRNVGAPKQRRREIDPDEAVIVRQIFDDYAGGLGLRTIAHRLNAEGALSPTPRRAGRPRGWAPSTIREILHRSLYRGVIEWGRTKKRDQWGQKRYLDRPESEWIRREAPELRIVTEAQWDAAHARLDGARQNYLRGTGGQLWGRPSSGIESKYLLTGFAICAACGGSLHVRTRDYRQRRVPFYGCSSFHLRGRAVCENNLELSMLDTNAAVIGGIEEELLDPTALAIGVEQACKILTAPAEDAQPVRAELADVEARIRRLGDAIQLAGDIGPLVEDLKALTSRRERLQGRLSGERRVGVAELRALEAELRGYLAEWAELLHRNPQQSRQMLRKVIDGRIIVHPRDKSAELEFRCSLGRLIAGLHVPKAMVTPAGFEPAISTLKGSDSRLHSRGLARLLPEAAACCH